MAPPLEISIPTTSLHTPSDGSKPYTLYNITLRLPLSSFVVQRRYSDFAALHKELTAQVGSPPPAPLPAKSWLRSTVSSPELTEQRRQGLETYLRAVAEPPDRRWRDTPAWRAFLNLPALPSGRASSLASGSGQDGVGVVLPAVNLRDANVAAASDPATWVDLNKEMKRELKAAQAALERREHATEAAEQLEAEAVARKALIRAGSLLGPLEEGLGIMKEKGRLGPGEYNRRKGVLEAAKGEKEGLDQLATQKLVRRGTDPASGGNSWAGAASESDGRARLLQTTQASRRPAGRQLGRPLPETERTRELDNEGVLQLQKETMREQDEDLGVLARVLRKQNLLARAMLHHIDEDNELLDEANARADSLQRNGGGGGGGGGAEEYAAAASSHSGSSSSSFSSSSSSHGNNAPPPGRRRYQLVELSERTEALAATAAAMREDRVLERQGITVDKERERAGGGSMVETVLLLMVRLVLAGAQGVVVLEWLLVKTVAGLVWMVELGLALVLQVQQSR
ncbi:hypothetical protein VTJ49DRAFT_725 [Mycothermus thermophilus]|uniref:PX domain-containing protein n=1 Tax=Humicola insolens TaxID=85995 RepID=A0ABR3VE99_HUMIN